MDRGVNLDVITFNFKRNESIICAKQFIKIYNVIKTTFFFIF